MNQNLILVVDDEPEICGEISGFLTRKGYRVVLAHNGNDAIELFQKQKPILVLTDYKMPGMNGIDLLRRIKSMQKEIHVVLISGAADSKTIVAAIKEDAFDFLMKPIDMKQLLAIVATAIEKTKEQISKDVLRQASYTLFSDMVDIGESMTVLYFNNDLDELTAEKYDAFIQKIINEQTAKKNMVFILNGVRYINNIGLNFLIEINKFIKRKGNSLYMCHLSPQVDVYLKSLGYLNYFNVESSLESLKEKIKLS
jgi:anti-anti-sigma factor